MKFETSRIAGALALSSALVLSGCQSQPPAPAPVQTTVQTQPAPGQAQQGTLNADGTFTPAPAGQKTVIVERQVPVQQQRPVQRTYNNQPSNQPAYRQGPNQSNQQGQPNYQQPRGAEIPSGSSVAVRITETLAASRNNVGDSFSGVLEQPLQNNGYVMFQRGTRVNGTVVAAKGRGRFSGAGDLGIELTSIGGSQVTTSAYEKNLPGKGRRTAETVGGGAGLGAVIGGIVGGGKGAAIGAATGAAVGGGVDAYTGNNDVVIPSESVVTFTLTSPIVTR